MCVIETRTYVYPNGQRYTADYPRLCRDSNGISPCQYLRREQTELPGEAMPALSTNAPSPSSQSFPPTPPNFVNVEYRQPATVERRASKKDKDGRRTIKPEVFIRIGSSKKRDKEKEKRYKRYSGESVGTSGDSDIVVIESPTSRGPQRVSFMPGPSVPPPPPPAPAAPPISSAFHGGPGQPVSYTAGNYNTTYAHPPPPPPPPPPRNPPAAPMGESPPSSPDPTRRRRRRNPVELHQANPLPSAPSAATPRDNGRRARRNSTASAPANDNEFMMRQDERARLRAENQRREQERRRIAEEARQAKLERERAEARDQARKEERERRRQKERDEEEARRAAQARADAQREASRFAERERQRKEAADRRREEDARRQAEEDRRKAEEARLRREQETAAANARAATRDAERAAAREKQRRSEEDARRRNERATFRERARALEETTEQMARERAAFRQRDSLEADLQDAAAEYEASREYWSPRAGMSSAATPRLRNETRQISGGTRDPGPSTALRHSVRHVAPGAINQAMPLARGRGETIHERGERVIAEARAEAAQARAQDRTRDIMDRFAGMTMEDDDSGDSGFGGLLHSARRRATSRGAHDGGYYSDYEGGKRRKRYF